MSALVLACDLFGYLFSWKEKEPVSSIKFLMIFILKELYGIGGSRLKVYKIMN